RTHELLYGQLLRSSGAQRSPLALTAAAPRTQTESRTKGFPIWVVHIHIVSTVIAHGLLLPPTAARAGSCPSTVRSSPAVVVPVRFSARITSCCPQCRLLDGKVLIGGTDASISDGGPCPCPCLVWLHEIYDHGRCSHQVR